MYVLFEHDSRAHSQRKRALTRTIVTFTGWSGFIFGMTYTRVCRPRRVHRRTQHSVQTHTHTRPYTRTQTHRRTHEVRSVRPKTAHIFEWILSVCGARAPALHSEAAMLSRDGPGPGRKCGAIHTTNFSVEHGRARRACVSSARVHSSATGA